jgi:rSAM/selenodomain-associated transferase 2
MSEAIGALSLKMLVTIIIPTLNEEREIERLITTLRQADSDCEILVADGGSTDKTVALANALNVAVVHCPRGRGQQMRTAAQQAKGEILWFVHADTNPPPDSLAHIRATLRNPQIVGGNFGLEFDGGTRAARCLTTVYPALRRLQLCYGDSGFFIRRDVYEKIGGFRPLALFEDLDLLRRMKRNGKFVHLPCKIVTSSRRFEQKNFALVWLHWTTLQVLYWLGVSPNTLARWYRHVRRT